MKKQLISTNIKLFALIITGMILLAACGGKVSESTSELPASEGNKTTEGTSEMLETTQSEVTESISDPAEATEIEVTEGSPDSAEASKGAAKENAAKSAGEASSSSNEKPATRELFAMDTYMTLTAYGARSEEAVSAAADRIGELDALLSTGSEKSAVSEINRSGSGKTAGVIGDLLEKSSMLFEETGGAFDISIYPLMMIWGFTSGEYRVPTETEIQDTLEYVDAGAITWDKTANTVSLKDGMAIDFGGIAKGYTSADVVRVMKEYGVQHALINLGGNVQVLGTKPDGSPWRVGVQDPADSNGYIGILETADRAVITSGGYERFFEEGGKTYHHIIDPKTGYPAEAGLLSVTIVCDDGTLADGLSTSVFVLGKEKGIELWRKNADKFDMILLTEDGKLIVTGGIADAFSSDLPVEVVE